MHCILIALWEDEREYNSIYRWFKTVDIKLYDDQYRVFVGGKQENLQVPLFHMVGFVHI